MKTLALLKWASTNKEKIMRMTIRVYDKTNIFHNKWYFPADYCYGNSKTENKPNIFDVINSEFPNGWGIDTGKNIPNIDFSYIDSYNADDIIDVIRYAKQIEKINDEEELKSFIEWVDNLSSNRYHTISINDYYDRFKLDTSKELIKVSDVMKILKNIKDDIYKNDITHNDRRVMENLIDSIYSKMVKSIQE